jgi:hypothetical protein
MQYSSGVHAFEKTKAMHNLFLHRPEYLSLNKKQLPTFIIMI